MNKDVVIATIKSATKGANIILEWHRKCKVKKTCADVISKKVRAIGRVGINYDNMKSVQAKRENGDLPEESQPIWNGKGEWSIFPYLIRHTGTGQEYVRLYSGIGGDHAKVQFFKNGKPVEFKEVENDLLASEKGEKDGDCFCCKIEDMTSISWTPSVNIESEKAKEETTEKVTA